jgi:predicted HNH restriction endonuclease
MIITTLTTEVTNNLKNIYMYIKKYLKQIKNPSEKCKIINDSIFSHNIFHSERELFIHSKMFPDYIPISSINKQRLHFKEQK